MFDKEIQTWFCDKCGDSEPLTFNFQEDWKVLRKNGWRASIGQDGRWRHRCGACHVSVQELMDRRP